MGVDRSSDLPLLDGVGVQKSFYGIVAPGREVAWPLPRIRRIQYLAAKPHLPTRHPAVLPTFPRGATIQSLLLAVSRLDESTSFYNSYLRYYRMQGITPSPFARGAKAMSAKAFADRASPEQLILQHSAWPIYASLVRPQVAQAWFQRTRDGDGFTNAPEIHSPTRGALFASRWRACTTCASQQKERYGVGHWMVLHQLPGIGFCPVHDQPLNADCGSCGAALGGSRLNSFPGEPCGSCGSIACRQVDSSLSLGEAQLAALYVDLLRGNGIRLDAASRQALLRNAAASQSSKDFHSTLKQEVLNAYGCESPQALGQRLNAEVSSRAFELALEGGASNSVPAPLHIAVMAIVLAMLKRSGRLQDQESLGDHLFPEHEVDMEALGLPADEASDLLWHAANARFPLLALRARLSGRTIKWIQQQGYATAKRLNSFVRSLPPHLAVRFKPSLARKPLASKLRGASPEVRQAAHRAQILEHLSLGVRNRTELLKACSSSYKWALEFDAAWLNALLPRWGRPPPH